jgi:hypothetical protein
MIPFTPEQFFDVFRRYNVAVWPAQIALLAVAVGCTAAAYRAAAKSSAIAARGSLVLLSMLWIWTAFEYHRAFLASLTVSGRIFGSLFAAQAVLLLLAMWENGVADAAHKREEIVSGSIIIAYALIGYPALGFFLGRRFPEMPTFGTPCPTTIFTLGVFCLLAPRIPRFALAIPVLWAMIASSAAYSFAVHEDFGLPVAAIVTMVVVHQAAATRRNANQVNATPAMPMARTSR